MTDVYKYRYVCEEETCESGGSHVYEWLETLVSPSQCKYSSSHTLVADSVAIVDSQLDEVQQDADHAPMARIKYCKTGRHFQCHAVRFETAKDGSDAETNYEGSAIGYTSLAFYDSDEVAITEAGSYSTLQDRLDDECCMTDVTWHPDHSIAILGAEICILEEVASSHTLTGWFRGVPDIPKVAGGSVDFCQGGLDFRYMKSKEKFGLDGKTAKELDYDTSSLLTKMRTRFRHSVGLQREFQIKIFIFQDAGF